MKNSSPFRTALEQAVAKTVRSLRADGVVWMSVDNLRMVVPPPSPLLAGAPLGTNALFVYAEMFREVVAKNPFVQEGGAS